MPTHFVSLCISVEVFSSKNYVYSTHELEIEELRAQRFKLIIGNERGTVKWTRTLHKLHKCTLIDGRRLISIALRSNGQN